MTALEKLKLDHPDWNESTIAMILEDDCPDLYYSCIDAPDLAYCDATECATCWDREIPEKDANFIIDKTDIVSVVRCKDCLHWYERDEVCLKIYSDGALSQYAYQHRSPEDFCSYGKRAKEGEKCILKPNDLVDEEGNAI